MGNWAFVIFSPNLIFITSLRKGVYATYTRDICSSFFQRKIIKNVHSTVLHVNKDIVFNVVLKQINVNNNLQLNLLILNKIQTPHQHFREIQMFNLSVGTIFQLLVTVFPAFAKHFSRPAHSRPKGWEAMNCDVADVCKIHTCLETFKNIKIY